MKSPASAKADAINLTERAFEAPYIDVAMSTKSDAMKKIAERWERDGM